MDTSVRPTSSAHTGPSISAPTGPAVAWWEPLLACARTGDAFPEDHVRELRSFVRRAVRSALQGKHPGDEALLDDATQEGTMRVLQALTTFRGDSRFTTWATTVAVRVAFTQLRRAKWKGVSLEALRDSDESGRRLEPESRDRSSGASGLRDEVLQHLERAIRHNLTERQRTAIEAELAGMPLQEVADRMGTSSNALYKLLYDARKRLRDALGDAGFTADDVRSALDA